MRPGQGRKNQNQATTLNHRTKTYEHNRHQIRTLAGIARKTIPWFPTVNHDKCIGCELCFLTCGRGVYDVHDHKAWPERQYDGMVGCTTCANICPAQAITFPDKQLVQKIEREHKILGIVRKEAAAKHAKFDAEKARAQAENAVAATTTRMVFHVAGEFGEKRFLAKPEMLIKDRPFDIVNLKLEVPTLKGALEKTPSHMNFAFADRHEPGTIPDGPPPDDNRRTTSGLFGFLRPSFCGC